ncbi:type II secretion system F family protein [Blastopirellula marina]|uniref:Secretion protein n=1 Tax=Blastopirellula marina TaxID=124 RepID=A0A2S8GKN8_9BACT|nr:type II secretion system F family protein [Blastopirellula marina]PQO45015.1 secretion protein [Blastopirellula marina]
MLSFLIPIVVFVGIAALVGGVALSFRGAGSDEAEMRLDALTGAAQPRGKEAEQSSGLLSGFQDEGNALEAYVLQFFNLRLFLDQADMGMSVANFVMISGGLAAAGGILPIVLRAPFYVAPITAVLLGALPLGYVHFKRKSRLSKFGKQLPDALELISRALRAGHSLGAGFRLVSEEMDEPIGREFQKVFEAQNLGVSLEDAITDMTERVPNLDLKFFGTAIILQRQTGGDLAEILDKIGRLVRQRLELFGTIQALTGEGRISGIVLLGLPPALFVALWRLNPGYVMTLFTDPLGNKMLAVAIIMQIIGAYVIQKIIDIKV